MNIFPKNESNVAVDWWFIYKIPKIAKGDTNNATTGYEYMYYDPVIGKLSKSNNLLVHGIGSLDYTLKSVFDAQSITTGWVIYNDELPDDLNKTNANNLGHTKGVIAFDTESKTALWLLHSWPKYLEPHKPSIPTPIYGQTFLCLSIDLDTANTIADQMSNHQEPQVYSSNIPTSLDKNSAIYKLTQKLNPSTPADANVICCKTRSGMPFKVIAKNRKWGKDFWNDLVGPTLGVDIHVESWIRGSIPPVIDSDGTHKTFDVKYVDMRPLGAPWVWSELNDHAKWGVSTDSDWVCVGDINRMISQESRGGGAIAFQDNNLWSALSQTNLLVPPHGLSDLATKKIIKETHKH